MSSACGNTTSDSANERTAGAGESPPWHLEVSWRPAPGCYNRQARPARGLADTGFIHTSGAPNVIVLMFARG